MVPSVYRLFEQFLGAAESDAVLAERFLRRTSLLDSRYVIPPPWLIARTVRHNSGAWLAARRAGPATIPDYFDVERSESVSV